MSQPKALLFDYWGTLVHQESFDLRARIEALLEMAVGNPHGINADTLLAKLGEIQPR